MKICKLTPEQVSEGWLDLRGFLDAALKKYAHCERYPLDVLYRDLMLQNNKICWVILAGVNGDVVKAVTVTETVTYPMGDALNIFLTGGEDMDEWGDMLHQAMVKHATQSDCQWIDTGSRRGIGKHFYDRLGYVRRQENYIYELKNHD